MPQEKETWEERFSESMQKIFYIKPINIQEADKNYEEVKQFISQEIQNAREEEGERIIELVKGNHKGAFIDD